MKQWLLSLSHRPFPTFLPPPLSSTFNPQIRRPKISKIKVTLNSVDESTLTARERRQMRNERRESKPAHNWKEEVEMRLIKKPKKSKTTLKERLNFDNFALLGPRWWMVKVSSVSSHQTAERIAKAIARNFPEMDFKVHIPSVNIRRKLKNGSISVKPKPLYPGYVFLRCVMNKELHGFIRECHGVRGFLGNRVTNAGRQINKPKPVDEVEVETMFERVKEEQEKADKAFEQEQRQTNEALDSKNDLAEPNTTIKPRGRGRKAAAGKAKSLKPGSSVQVLSGAFAGFTGTLKKHDKKTGLATVGFTVFGKETLADIDANEILAEMN